MARKETFAFDDSMPSGETMSDPAQPPVDETGEAPEAPETMAEEGGEGESLSLDLFGDKEPKVGDVVTLKVTGIDPENGRVTVTLPGAPKRGGIDAAAASMDEEDQASITA
jgi:hypothetical protein